MLQKYISLYYSLIKEKDYDYDQIIRINHNVFILRFKSFIH